MIASSTRSLGQLLDSGRFEPAKIQRAYQWQTTHVEKLLNDLVAAFHRMQRDPGESELADDNEVSEAADGDPSEADDIQVAPSPIVRRRGGKRMAPDAYFLGTIVFYNGRAPIFEVYDGLQRLVSIAILLSVLRDTWPAIPHDKAALIQALLLDPNEHRQRVVYKTSGRSLGAVVQNSKPEKRNFAEGDVRIRETAEFFRKQFDRRWSSERRSAFLYFLSDCVQLTVTETDNRSVAYQMFVGANARGLRLGVGDVVKSLIAEQVRANGGTAEQVDACARRWSQAQHRLQRDFDNFIHAVEVYQFLPDDAVQVDPRAYEAAHTTGEKLQELFDELTPPEQISEWIERDFARMASVFERARAHNFQEHANGADLSLRQLSFLGWTEWQPLLLSICLKYENLGSSKLAKEIHALKRACYIVELLDWAESTRRRKFMEAIEAREANRNPFGRQLKGKPTALYFMPKGGAVKSASRALRAPLTSKQKRGALVRYVETLHWKGNVPRTSTNGANVEHVLPSTSLGEWSVAFTDDEREALTNKLGNLCILDRQANHAIGNKEWRYKANEYFKWRRTFRGVDKVLTTAQAMTEEGGKYPWCAKTVERLTEELAALAEASLLLA